MSFINKFIPYDVYKDIHKIDYNKLYSQGRKIILFDLDNTIISYDEKVPDDVVIELFEKIKEIGFKIIVMSNNKLERVRNALDDLDVFYICNAMKPLKKSYKMMIEVLNITNPFEVIAIGDQLLTDVYGGRRVEIDTILVNPIRKKTEKWYTRFNRNTENFLIKKMKKKHFDVYTKIKECRGEELER